MSSKVPSPYIEHPGIGVWCKPEANTNIWDIRYPESKNVTPNEREACDFLSEALFRNWLKGTPGNVLDIGSPHNFIADSFKAKNCSAQVIRDLAWLGLQQGSDTKFNLVTMIHSFQTMSVDQGIVLFNILNKMMPADGTLFIRIPDHEVPGYERDLNPETIKSATCFWDLHSFLEFLYQNPLFKVVETYTVNPGQRDYLLKPIHGNRPSVCIGMIAKNEERDLPRCLDSLNGVADGICFIDTGSTDKTIEVVESWAKEQGFSSDRVYITTYTEASEKDENGNWKLWNFSKARNQYVEWIEKSKFDYVLWMDADDEVKDPKKLRSLVMWSQYKIHGIQIQDGSLRWPHHRLWKTGHGIKYSGRCHEYPSFSVPDFIHQAITIRHDSAPGAGESSNSRNLRILQREFEEDPTSRCAFYLGNTYKDAGKYKEAIPAYKKRLDFGFGYVDEYYFALLYKGRCERNSGDLKSAYDTLMKGAVERPEWAEFWMELSFLEYGRKDYNKALGFCMMAKDRAIAPTALFREKDKYIDQPERMASWCLEFMGLNHSAYEMALQAKRKIGGPDKGWEERIERLKSKLDLTAGASIPVSVKKEECIVLHRPGAIGDILITLNNLKALKEKNPGKKVIYKVAPQVKTLMEGILLEAGVDGVISTSEENPPNSKMVNLVGYPLSDGYPYKPMKKHLIEYFAIEMGVDYSFDSLSIKKPNKPEGLPEMYATLHVKAGWSPYKNWSPDRWELLLEALTIWEIPVVQIGGDTDPYIKGAIDFRGKPLIESVATLAHATIHIGVDSWTNHATNIKWDGKRRIPAVILWGSTQWDAAGYEHNSNISLDLPCQPCFREDPKISAMPLGVCPNPQNQTYDSPKHACMFGISPDIVFKEVLSLWRQNSLLLG